MDEKKEMDEKKVKEYLKRELVKKYEFLYPEFALPKGGKVDFLSASWENNYEISINGFECKGRPSEYAVMKTLREQIAEYQKVIPRVYLVCHSKKHEELKHLCEVNGVGLINVDEDGKTTWEEPTKKCRAISTSFLDEADFLTLRTIAAMYLSFKESFEKRYERELRKGPYWISTPEGNKEPQFNAGFRKYLNSVFFSVNLENSKKVLNRVDLRELLSELSSLPENYWLNSRIKFFPAPRKQASVELLKMNVRTVKLDDLTYLQNKSKNNVIYLQIGTYVWNWFDILPKRDHLSRIKSAEEKLTNLYQIMSK